MNKTTKKLILFLLVFNFVFALLGMKVNDVKAEGLEVIKTHTGSDLTYRGSSEKVYKLSEYNYPTNQLRAVWVTVFAGDISRYTSETQFKQMMNNVLDDMDKMGMNAIVFHVRTHNNALYQSSLNPLASWWSGVDFDVFDPLEWLIYECHQRGIEFHAWLNPYRIGSTYGSKQEVADAYSAYPNNPASNENNVLIGSPLQILDPGIPEVREFIIDTCLEIVENYDVDAIHFDDYFYPGSGHKQYKKYASLSNKQKKANVNKMVQTVYGNIKAQNPNLLFGISPAGNVEYCESLGADVKTWMKGPGYVDYIAPQIYWSNSYRVGKKTVRMFDNRFAKWKRLNKGNIPMYIGLALYRGGMKDASDRGWRKSKKIIASQISKIRRSEKAYGYILFSYESLYKKACRYEVKNMLARIARIKVTKVNTDGTTRLKTTVWPARLGQTVTWKSSNPSIASITNKGRIRVKQNGIVKFTVKKAGKSVSVKINTEDL